MTAATAIAVGAAVVAVAAAAVCAYLLYRLRTRQQMLEREIDRGKAEFDRVVEHELVERSEELSRLLARSRADTNPGW